MDKRAIVLRGKAGLYYAGPDAPQPWLEDVRQSMQFSATAPAWRYAKELERAQALFLQGNPIELETFDPQSNESSRLVATDTPYPVLAAYWRRALGEPLPLDIPAPPENLQQARERMTSYLHDVDWQGMRARGGDASGLDPSFGAEAERRFRFDAAGFRDLWRSVVPPDIEPPDLASQMRRLGREPAEKKREAPNEVVASPSSRGDGADTPPAGQLPGYVRRHFVQSGAGFYYKQRPDVLAFAARGQSFRAHDDSVMSATAIIEMARQRGWSSVRVRGSRDFRRAVWMAATERGMQVFGYSPTRGEQAVRAQGASPDGHPPRPSANAGRQATGRAPDPSLTGVLLAMGDAPYRHDRANSASFFVTLRDGAGQEHTHWGVGLKKAIEQAAVTPGQAVALRRLGRESVAVDRPVLDAQGDVSYRETQVVKRSVWDVRVLDNTRDGARNPIDTEIPGRASADPALAKALALIEERMPGMSPELRQELHRHFDAAYARQGHRAGPDARGQGTPAKSFTRTARVR